MGKLQRDRGASTEREICNYLQDELGIAVKRKLGQARDSGEDISVPPFRIEVKRRKGFAGLKFLQQCETGSCEKEIPVVVVRVDGDKEPMVLLRLNEFVKMMREKICE